MGLLTVIRKMRAKEREIRVLILGLDNAGKTTVTKKFMGEDTSKVEPTFGRMKIMRLSFKNFRFQYRDS